MYAYAFYFLHIFAQIKNCPPGTAASDPSCQTTLPQPDPNIAVQTILQIVFGIIAIVTVIFIMISALKFITASGDPQSIAKARQSIIYAVIGLGIAISAEIIVTFVLGHI